MTGTTTVTSTDSGVLRIGTRASLLARTQSGQLDEVAAIHVGHRALPREFMRSETVTDDSEHETLGDSG